MSQVFKYEKDFEDAVVNLLPKYGWNQEVIEYPDENKLLDNWKQILFDNNNGQETLNGFPLTDGEMQQLMDRIKELKNPLALNTFINGNDVAIVRDNKDDRLHYGKAVYLKIYHRDEIAGGDSRYQIVRQPRFTMPDSIYPERRGDLMLLINGMPLIHIELKRSGIPLSDAANQIKKYHKEGVFKGLFSLVQVFVAMTPDDGIYFANPGYYENFNSSFFFHWADKDNNPYTKWHDVVYHLLNIPMAHQLIGFYTVADHSDGVLKVMRSYQYYAAWAVTEAVHKKEWNKIDWTYEDQLGGYVWHTTGSGKTMTSFKSAQLIADSDYADKVVFMLDRIELGNQTFLDYKGFAGSIVAVQDTDNTGILIKKLKSSNASDKLIVTSIQKMSRIREENAKNITDIEKMQKKRLVFIIDECHRDVFGDMLQNIKKTFPRAIFFGFTGTPIFDENRKKMNCTADIFGGELHRYTIAQGIIDKNVLGFDPYRVCTFKDSKVKEVVALDKAKAVSVEEAMADEAKKKVFLAWRNSTVMKMAGYEDENGQYIRGYEDYIPKSQYLTPEHQRMVVEDIKENWITYKAGTFHALFATSSINEAIEYYRRIKNEIPDMKVTALFDPSIDNSGDLQLDKEDGIEEILKDYNKMYNQRFKFDTHYLFKKDITARLAHKAAYLGISTRPEEQLDLLIVVNQMLTGFDSKWINTLYIDKEMEYESIIQSFSRTNRLFAEESKPFGIIRYYRRPYTMENRIKQAFKLYSGDRPIAVFVSKIEKNIEQINKIYREILPLFPKNKDNEQDLSALPKEASDRAKFAKLFNQLNAFLDAAKVQGFTWNKTVYETIHKEADEEEHTSSIKVEISQAVYMTLLLRYKELNQTGGESPGDDIPYDLKGYLVETDTGKIDADFMNSNFAKFIKAREQKEDDAVVVAARNALHKTFATLTKEEQKFANMFLHDIEQDLILVDPDKTFRDYITQYQSKAKDEEIRKIVDALGLDELKLRELLDAHVDENNIDKLSRFTVLKDSVDFAKATVWFERMLDCKMPPRTVSITLDDFLRKFILSGGFDIEEDKSAKYKKKEDEGLMAAAVDEPDFSRKKQ
ncbi:MAG: HsdR family type I site-specific deoxyribonuclease [Treponema sp.]|nr:HsdR family type I site-specific deoxyribonuclease [Treponema sp.]